MPRRLLIVLSAAAFAGLLTTERALAQDPAPADPAAAAIQQKGGKLERDEKAEGKPITTVSFATQPTTDDDLACVKGLGSLQKLTLNNTKVTDAGLANVEGLAALKKLYLVDTQVTDAGLERLRGLASLEVLSLAGTPVTDAGLEHLKGLAQLKTLFLAGTKVTDEGVKKLQEALPMLKIER